MFPGSERLKPYVSRLAIEWLRDDPSLRHRQIDGTLVFVDISGFTSLTERLSRKGKVGAEEMNDVLDATFTELLSVAYDYGAGVVKWGGDAILLLFDEDGHAARACRGAWEMQRTMREVGRLHTSAGRVKLGMSVGVHTGRFDFFFVGNLHRELVIVGLATNATVAAESAAGSGEIVISRVTASALPAALVGPARAPGFLLVGAPAVDVGRSPDVGAVDDVDLARCVSVAIAGHLVEGGGEAEHRQLTIAFLQFSGTDELLASAGPDAVADALEQCFDTVEGIALEYKVAFFDTDIAAGGGKIMLVSGAPTSSGNDEERMLRTLRAVADAQLALRLKIGVNRGRIFAADFGPPYRRTYSFKGDAANVAARLMAKAAPGQILATEEVLARSRLDFEVEPLEPFFVKGKAEPVHALAVGAAVGSRTRRAEAPLVGRVRELQTLLDAFSSAQAYEGRIVEIVGEPGIGKSRLIEAVGDEVGPGAFLTIQCDEYEATTPYHPFQILLRALLAPAGGADEGITAPQLRRRVKQAAPHLLPWLPLVAVPVGLDLSDTPETEPLEGDFRKRRLQEVVTDLIGMLLLTPTVIAFEDVHWLDEASTGLLGQLVKDIETRPWVIILARRAVSTGFVPSEDSATRIELEPLGDDDAETLVHAVTAELTLPPHEIAALAERAGGNPLFLTELLTARAAGGLGELPESVEGLMMVEIDRLAPADRRILRCAAVIGSAFTPDLVAASLGEPIDAAVWSRLGHYLGDEEGGALRFRHALVRDAAYEGLPFSRRRELHERVGMALEARTAEPDDEAALLSLHFFYAHDYERAWRYSRKAADRAQTIYANVEASRFLERALEAARRLRPAPEKDVGETWEALGDVRLRLNEFEPAGTAFRAARRRLQGDAVEEARLMSKEALARWRLGRYPQALRWLTRALSLLEGVEGTGAGALRAQLFVWSATVRQDQRRPKEAIDWCRRAVDEAERAGARDVLAHAYHLLDWAFLALGHPEEAVYASRAIAIHEELGDLDRLAAALNNLGGRAYVEGRWNETLALLERARAACETIGDRARASITAFNSAEILIDQGRLEEARPLLNGTLRVWRAAGNRLNIAEAMSLLGRLETRSGRFGEAAALLEEARATCEAEGDDFEALMADVRLVECRLLEGKSDAALALVGDALARAEAMKGVSVLAATLHRLRGWALMQVGEIDLARHALDESMRIMGARDANLGIRSTDFERALTLDALARLDGLAGLPVEPLTAERDVILERLGVVATPKPPLASSLEGTSVT